MDRVKGVLKSLRTLLRKREVERELDEEMQFHVELQTQANLRAGMDPKDARRAALMAFGGVERFKEARRQASWIRVVEDLLADVRYSGRMLVRRPGFATAVTLTLGLSIGGTTAIFSVVDRLFLRAPAGVRAPEQVRKLFVRRDTGRITTREGGPGSYVDFESMRDHVKAFESVAAYFAPRSLDLGRGVEAEQIRGTYATYQFLPLLRVRPALGRFYNAEEDGAPAAHQVAVISHAMWQSRFAGARDVLDKSLWLNGKAVQIIGVTEKGFSGISADPSDVFLPMASDASPQSDFRKVALMAGLDYVARLAPTARETVAGIQAEAALAWAAEAEPGLDRTPELMMRPLTLAAAPYRSPTADLSLWLALVAGLVLIIACANVANLLLARSVAARRELAVRLAIGAGRGRLIRQHLTESIVLALLGGAAGVLVARWSMGLIGQFPLPPAAGTLDLRILAFTLVLSVLSGVFFGILPALRAGAPPIEVLREARSTLSLSGNRTRRVLVVVQVMLSVILLIGAGLFVRSLRQVYAIDPGVDLDRVTVVTVNLGRAQMSREERESFYESAQARLAALPGVLRVAMVHFYPLDASGFGLSWNAPRGADIRYDEGPYLNLAGPGYFEAVGTRILEGREFNIADGPGSEPVAVVNQEMARALAPDGRAVGECVAFRQQIETGGCTRIIGIVENIRRRYLEEKPVPYVFLSRLRNPAEIGWGGPALVIRTRGPAAGYTPRIRAVMQTLRPDLPYITVRPLTEIIRRDVLPYRLGATLFSLFGLLALVLSAIGLAGVLGYFVTERTPEIGIRRSLGAPLRAVVALVIKQAMVPVALGVGLGLMAAVSGSRLIGSLLFGVSVRDPIAFGGAIIFLLATAVIATLIPARRAARVDPMLAIRHD